MIMIPATDLFSYPGDCRVITTNTVGAMGKGIALGFKERYPDAYWTYKNNCRNGYHHIGVPELVITEDGLRWLLFPTKAHWRAPSEYSYLQQGLQYLIDNIGEPDYVEPQWHLVFPPLGCGNGFLEFSNVKRLMQLFDDRIPNSITLIKP